MVEGNARVFATPQSSCEIANGGQGGRAYFFAALLWTDREMQAPSGGATQRP